MMSFLSGLFMMSSPSDNQRQIMDRYDKERMRLIVSLNACKNTEKIGKIITLSALEARTEDRTEDCKCKRAGDRTKTTVGQDCSPASVLD